jgi:carboxyl-terminal processing protease
MFRFGRSAVLLAALVGSSHAGEATIEPVHAEVAKLVGMTLQTEHYSKEQIDDEVSGDWFDNYLDTLDYSRIYFLQSDIEEFSKYRTVLDDDILQSAPKLEAAVAIYNRYLQRVDERVDRAMKLLSKPQDFADPEARVDTNRHEDPWAKTPKALDQVWGDRLAEQLLRMELAGDPRDKALDRLKKRYERIRGDANDLETADVLELYLGALTRVFDPHSAWFKPITKENFDIDMSDSLTGIGAELRQEDGYTTITRLIPGGPAEASGVLQPSDRIVAVAQGDNEAEEVIDMRLDKVVKKIRGPIDTEVVLSIWPGDATDPAERQEIRLVRKKVKLDRAAAKGEVKEIDGIKVGVIDIPSFYRDSAARAAGDPNWAGTAKDTAAILRDFRGQGVDAVIIDLRKNGGGRLDESLELTGLFIDDGPVVQIRSRAGNVDVLRDPSPGSQEWDGPLLVLTSELSASASEIFAAAIQDHRRGLVIGSTSTHGKGTVQDLQEFARYFHKRAMYDYVDHGGAMKFTTHMFYRPAGGGTQVKGVEADVVIPSPWEGMDIREGDLDHALEWDKIRPASFRPSTLGLDLAKLQKASSTRVNGSMEFAFMKEDLLERERSEREEEVSLHLPTRQAEMKRIKDIEAAREKARKDAGWDGETELDPILDEALQVARDVVGQLAG